MTPSPDATGGPGARGLWIVALAVFAPVALLRILQVPGPDDLSYRLFPDATMRLVMVRDLLNGQGWFDLVQHRLGPDGVEMHWSRLVDLPLAILILAFDPIVGRAQAEYLTLVLWPLLMLWAQLWMICRIAAEWSRAAAVFAGVIAAVALYYDPRFAPGNIDHHNVQLVLLFVALAGLVLTGRPLRLGTIAGIAAALGLAVGLETVPMIAAVALGFAAGWVLGGPDDRRRALGFFTALLAALPLVALATAPPAVWRGGTCDALSRDLMIPVMLGAGLSALGILATRDASRPVRALAFGGAALAVMALVFLAMPTCLAGPYGTLDPYLKARFFASVGEARGLATMTHGPGAINLGYYPLGLVASGVALWMSARESYRIRWLALSAMLLLATAITLYQIRGALSVKALAAIPMGVLVAHMRARWLARVAPLASGVSAILALVLSLPITWAILYSRLATTGPETVETRPLFDCFDRGALAVLAGLPRGLVMSNPLIGNQVLLHTPHRVIAAPYHRDEAGMIAQLKVVLAPDTAEAERAIRESGVDYLLSCDGDPTTAVLARAGFTGYGQRLSAGEVPPFLDPVPVPPGAPLRIYRVTK